MNDHVVAVLISAVTFEVEGSVQHFAGMKTSGLIIAINEDAEANIMKNCDYYVVGDLHEIVPLLTRQLKEVVGNT